MGAGDTSPAHAAACTAPNALVETSNPDVFVGTGTPASCNETAFANALAVGGTTRILSAPSSFELGTPTLGGRDRDLERCHGLDPN